MIIAAWPVSASGYFKIARTDAASGSKGTVVLSRALRTSAASNVFRLASTPLPSPLTTS